MLPLELSLPAETCTSANAHALLQACRRCSGTLAQQLFLIARKAACSRLLTNGKCRAIALPHEHVSLPPPRESRQHQIERVFWAIYTMTRYSHDPAHWHPAHHVSGVLLETMRCASVQYMYVSQSTTSLDTKTSQVDNAACMAACDLTVHHVHAPQHRTQSWPCCHERPCRIAKNTFTQRQLTQLIPCCHGDCGNRCSVLPNAIVCHV